MKRGMTVKIAALLAAALLCACGSVRQARNGQETAGTETGQATAGGQEMQKEEDRQAPYTADTRIEDVMNDPVLGDWGRLLFPVNSSYYRGDTLGELELSKKGYNAFAVIYRPGAETACEDLARAIRFIFDHAEELEVDTEDYSLWGGSAGARMAAWLGSLGTESFGEPEYPRPAAVIMQYTGYSDYSENDPPTYACVGDQDGIANWHTMETRLNHLQELGIDTEFHVYSGLGHGFGLGTGTAAEGWLDDAVAFWESHMERRPETGFLKSPVSVFFVHRWEFIRYNGGM